MKPNKDFKMPKYVKTMLASIPDSNQRSAWKKMMIEGVLAERAARAAKFRDNKGDI